jgi:glycosyltransferase involved in cell wall biosynthesis
MNRQQPIVSICCLTFNHAKFVRQCLDGFLLQKTSFPIEILVHDDASTDDTAEILREYEQKYPDIIFPLYETQNKFSNGYRGRMDIVFNYSRARGKYIASCEGDDYWTDPLKLQKQVDFMESHPEYSVCFHRCQYLYEKTGKVEEDGCGKLFAEGQEGVDVTIDMFFKDWITQPLTILFRRESFSPQWQKKYKYYRDTHEIYHLLKVGKGYIFSFVGGVYRIHSGGVASILSPIEYSKVYLPIDGELYRKTHEAATKRIYCETLQHSVVVFSKENKLKSLYYAIVEFAINGKYKTFGKNLRRIIKEK